MFQFPQTNNNDELQNTQVIAKILSFLSPHQLREARLVSSAFNKIITTHPKLFWAKNEVRVEIKESSLKTKAQVKQEWTQLRANELIAKYNCPNFHFIKTDFLAPDAVIFFHSPVRHQIKYFVLTNCSVTEKILIHFLACIGITLEHLEIRDFRNVQSTPVAVPESKSFALFFPRLATLILSGAPCGTSATEIGSTPGELPCTFLHTILNGSKQLQNIALLEWNAKTFQSFTKLLGSLDPKKLENVQVLEITCRVERDLDTQEQYNFLKPLGSICLPSLKKLKVCFGDLCCMEGNSVENKRLMDTMTNSVATLIEGCASTLEHIELRNCPVSNAVFRMGVNKFPSLRHINTSGSFFSTPLDKEANRLLIPKRSIKDFLQVLDRVEENNELEEIPVEQTTTENRSHSETERVYTKTEVYVIVCAMFVLVVITHFGTAWALGPHDGAKCEIMVYALVALWFKNGLELSEFWATLFSK